MEKVKAVAEKIRKLEIQGAANVALEALKAVEGFAGRHPGEPIGGAVDLLVSTRPTEPMMINTLGYLKKLEADAVPGKARGFIDAIARGTDRVVEIGANIIEDGMTVQTICHSSTVVKILLKARNDGKQVRVVNTETRPLYQGRKTAEELYKGGMHVAHYVDSAMMKAMKDDRVDLCLIGLDAIFMDGSVANKIGSGLLALAADSMNIPLYACGHSLKLDRNSLFAKSVEIEQRDPREIWDYPVDVRNPAFELVPAKHIKGIVTDLGILPPAVAGFEIMKERADVFKKLG